MLSDGRKEEQREACLSSSTKISKTHDDSSLPVLQMLQLVTHTNSLMLKDPETSECILNRPMVPFFSV